jgi:hypothetical protein
MGNCKSNEALHFYSKKNTFFNNIDLQSSVIILPDDDLHQFSWQVFVLVVSYVSVYYFSKSSLNAFETFFTGNGTPVRTELGEGPAVPVTVLPVRLPAAKHVAMHDKAPVHKHIVSWCRFSCNSRGC